MHTSMSKLETHLLVTGGPEPRPAPLLRRDNRVSVAAGAEPGLVPPPGAGLRSEPELVLGIVKLKGGRMKCKQNKQSAKQVIK